MRQKLLYFVHKHIKVEGFFVQFQAAQNIGPIPVPFNIDQGWSSFGPILARYHVLIGKHNSFESHISGSI